MNRLITTLIVVLPLCGCGHSDSFVEPEQLAGPRSTGADVQLTFNADQDYWPNWTEDGRGILYAFVQPGATVLHRCIGLIPAVGGARTWELCDNRATQGDTVSSFGAYALGADGRLLYVEAVTPGPPAQSPLITTLWLADSAAPFARTALLNLPMIVGNVGIAWLSDIAWTGPTTFIALAQDFSILAQCKGCVVDSIFANTGAVVTGMITAGRAALQVVSGTLGATGYSLADNGASIAFIVRDDTHLYTVPLAGGTAVNVGPVTTVAGDELLGVSCRASECVVADDPVTLGTVTPNGLTFPSLNMGQMELRGVSLATGTVQILRSSGSLLATPRISPASGDVVAQVGGSFGHLQTFTSSASDLHLYPGLVP